MKFILMLSAILVLSGQTLSTRQQKKLDKLITKVWEVEADSTYQTLLDSEDAVHENDLLVRVEADGQMLGFIAGRKIVDNYLNYFPVFVFDSKGSVLRAEILEVNTIKGSEINSRRWLNQFTGYAGAPIRFGREIDGISGATLSGISMVKEIKYYHNLVKQELN